MGRGKKKRKAKQHKRLQQRIIIRKKMGKPVFFTLTHCAKKLQGLTNRYIYKANMHKLLFISTRFYNVKYQSSIITNCNFRDTEFIGVDFFNCNMRDISFKNAKLNNVVFYNCNLKNADFTGASFSHVSFICTNTKVAKGLSESDDGISIYKTYKHIDLSSVTESALIGLSSNPSIFKANVLHVNKSKLNHWVLGIIKERYGNSGLEFMAKKLISKSDWDNMYTIFSYTLLLDKCFFK